jgi:hypothetical protein
MDMRRRREGSRVPLVRFVNVVSAGCGLLFLAITVEGAGDRGAALGALVAVPVLLLQSCFALLPAVRCARAAPLETASRRSLLLLAMLGPLLTVAAGVVSACADGGC